MSKISLKTDYEDGKVLQASELNVNNNVTMLGVNDNFNRINNLSSSKADTVDVDNKLSAKADVAFVNNQVAVLNSAKADKIELATKANQSDVDMKANKSYVDSQLETKANQSYVEAQLASKVDIDTYNNDLATKADKEVVGDLEDLKTDDKSSIVNAINSINTEAKAIATVDTVGVVKPDGTTITIDQDGTIHSIGGGTEPGGTSDYNDLSNKPQINSVEIKGNVSLTDLGLMSSRDINTALGNKANSSDVYSKNYIDTNVIAPLNDKATKSELNSALESKANTNDVYSKTATDELITGVNSSVDSKLLTKADIDTVYTKSEVNSLVNVKADNLSFEDEQLQLTANGVPIGDPVTLKVTGNEVVISQEQPQDNDWKLWIDSDEVQNLGSEVVNSLEGNETTKAPSVKAVNDVLNYSTEETVIGTFLGKPLYRKVIDCGALPNNSTKTINHKISNLGILVNIYGTSKRADGNILVIPNSDKAGLNYSVRFSVDNTNISIETGSDRTSFTQTYATLEYTKTTD